jgi:hypothetical protein
MAIKNSHGIAVQNWFFAKKMKEIVIPIMIVREI